MPKARALRFSVNSERQRGEPRRAIEQHHVPGAVGQDLEIRAERPYQIRHRVLAMHQVRHILVDEVPAVRRSRGDGRVRGIGRRARLSLFSHQRTHGWGGAKSEARGETEKRSFAGGMRSLDLIRRPIRISEKSFFIARRTRPVKLFRFGQV